MEQHELLLYLVECLEKLRIPYLITGSIASMAYGEPRFTNDIDIVADIALNQADAVRYTQISRVKRGEKNENQKNFAKLAFTCNSSLLPIDREQPLYIPGSG